jgi:hypothetical protein
MPIQIMPRETNWGESLGTGLGSGLSEGLQQLANMKLKQFQERQQAVKNSAAFKQMNPSLSDEQAMAYAMSSPEIQQLAFKQMSAAPEQESLYNLLKALLPDQFAGQGMEGMPGGIEQTFQQLAPETMPYQGGMIPGTGMPLQTQMQMPQQIPQQQAIPQQQRGFKLPEKGRLSLQNAKYLTDLIQKQQTGQQKLSQAERKQSAVNDKQLESFNQGRNELLQSSGDEAATAAEMIDIIRKHGGKFPGSTMGSMPRIIQNMWYDDPDIKRYMNLQDKLVIAQSQDIKGRPSDYARKLVEGAKAALNLPNKTKLKNLQGIIDARNDVLREQEWLKSQKDPRTGNYPTNINSMLSDYRLAQEDPLKYPDIFPVDMVIQTDDGKRHRRVVNKSGKPAWKDV